MKESTCTKKMDKSCMPHRREILGAIFILIATWLTITTLSSAGILGMFLVGAMLWCKKSGCCCSKECKSQMCCEPMTCEDSSEKMEKMDKSTGKKPMKKAKKENE